MANDTGNSTRPPSPNLPRPLAYEAVPLRILIVIDGRIGFHHNPYGFGLGFVIDTLGEDWLPPPRSNLSPTLRVEVSLATRDAELNAADGGGFRVLYKRFRFDQPNFQIDAWDQIWLFADEPSISDDADDADNYIADGNPLGDPELKALAEWMDRGGGLFAAGDHNNLGASMCHRIPRVRTMRKWTLAEGVPRRFGVNHNQTLQGPLPDVNAEEDAEGDILLQPIELVLSKSVKSWPFHITSQPHPILTSSVGPIDRFPDHMHEGELVADAEVELNRPLDIPGYTPQEYPNADPDFVAAIVGFAPTGNWKPRPMTIAYGHTTNPIYIEPATENGAVFFVRPDFGVKRFGMVGVYDGDPARIGRIVCDSTWHHWFSYNLHGIAGGDPAAYQKIQSYYRNIVLWLAKIPQRQRVLTATLWNVMETSSPMAFEEGQTPWEMGARATKLMTDALGVAWLDELIASHFNAKALLRIANPSDRVREPQFSRLPEDLVHQAVIGSIAKSLFPLLKQLRVESRKRSDVRVDTTSIEVLAKAGIARVPELLRDALTAAITSISHLRDALPRQDTTKPTGQRR